MPKKGVINNPKGRPRIWDSPEALLADFERFLAEQAPHEIKVLDNVARVKPGHELNDSLTDDDYEWVIEEVPRISKQGVLSIRHFAVWKGVHSTTITTGYAAGRFQEAYDRILGACEAYAESFLYDTKSNAKGTIFVLKNCYGWTDKPTRGHNSDIDVELSPEAQAELDSALAL